MERAVDLLCSISLVQWRVLAVVILATSIFIVNYKFASYDPNGLNHFKEKPLAPIAKRDLSMLGETGWSLKVSLETWLFSIIVINYRKYNTDDVMQIIRKWSEKGISNTISIDVESPYTRFLKILDDAREKKQEPVFNVSSEYDYHNLSKVLQFNDYVDCVGLLVEIDAYTGATENE